MYSIRTDIAAGLIEVQIAGFWDQDELRRFGRALTDAARSIAAAGRSHVLLCDYSEAAIQSQEVIAGFRALVADMPFKSRKLAVYTTGPFARIQARRVATVREDMGVFDDRAGALEWLLADQLDRYIRAG